MIKKLHLTHTIALATLAILLLMPGWGWGQIASLELGTTLLGGNTTGAATFTGKDANINTLPALTLTAGQQGQAGGNGYVASKAWNNASLNTATYWQFTVTASSGYQIAVTSLALRMYRSATGPASIALATDADSYAALIGGTQTLPSASNSTITFSGLTLSGKTSVTFRVYAYGASAANGTLRIGDGTASSLDINLQGTVTSSNSSASDIIGAANETSNIAYSSYQGSSITATTDAVRLFSFTIRDGGGSSDGDANPTILNAITFSKGSSNGVSNWANTIREAALFDGTTKVAEVSVTGETIAFTGLSGSNVTAADNGNKTLDLYVTFESAVTDNQQFQFQITNANVTAASSGSSTFTTFAAVNSSVSSDANRIEVTATKLAFGTNTSTVSINAAMSPPPTIVAKDANNNIDLDFASAIGLSTTGTFSGTATTSVSPAAGTGTATFDNLKFSVAGTGITIAGSYTGLTPTGNSNPFDVTDPQPEINLKQSTTSIVTGGSYDFSNQLSGSSSSAITFTIENLGTATLHLTGTPIVVKSGTNPSEFTIDQTSTTSTVSASGSTTFTVTFSPTSAGSKSAQLSIANDDATGSENPYLINLTGTGTVSSTSDITTTSGYSYTSNVAYASYQSASGLTTGNSVGVNGLTIRDGAGASDADNLGTTLSAISFSTGGSTAIRTAALFDGSTNVGETVVNGATTIPFSGLSLVAADNGTKDFELRVTYQAAVTDNQQITFTVSSATASTAGSGFATAAAGAAASTATGDFNRIEVTATKLNFVQQPTNASVNTVMTPAVTVEATDANNNRDLDYSTSISMTSSGTLTGTPVSGTTTSGLATFSTLTHTASGTGLQLTAASGSLSSATSGTFTVSSLLLVEDFSYTAATLLTANGWTAHSSSGTNAIPVATSSITYTGYLSSGVGNEVNLAATGEDDNKAFSSTNTGDLYASFLVNITSTQTTGDYFAHFAATSGSSGVTTFGGRVWVKKDASTTNFAFGLSSKTSTAANVNYTGFTYTPGTTYLVVVKYSFVSGTTNDVAVLYINPVLDSPEPSPTISTSSTDNATADPTQLTSFCLRQGASGSAPVLKLDGIRVSQHWEDIVGLTPTFTGTGDWSTTARWNTGAAPGTTANVIVNGAATISSAVVVNNTTINSSNSLTIAPTGSLTSTTLTNSAGNAGLVIKSDATGTGSLITASSPAATVERYVTKYTSGTTGNRMFHYISSPVASQAIHPEFVDYPTPATDADFYSYSETSNLWINTKADNGSWNGSFESTFAPGKGYSVAYPGDVTKIFTGNVYSYTSGSPLVMICSKTTGQGEGWNLLGNPFPSAIDWETVTRGSGMDKALYYYNSTYYSTYIDINGAYIGHGSQYIPAMQGFMVHASANGATVTIQNSDRAHHAQTTFYKSSNTVPNSLSLKVAEAGYEDEMFVHFTLGATANFDGDYDAYKLDAAGNGMPIIYSTAADNTKLAINGLPELTENTVVPVNFSAGTDGECTITADLQNLTDARVFLVDNKLTKVQNLSDNPVYTFTASTSDQPNRFKLTFGSVGIIEPLGAEHLQVYIDNGNLVVIGKTTTNAQIMVSNMLGQVVLRSQTNGNSLTKLNVNSIPNGVYVVSLVGNSKMVSEKIVVSK